MFCTIVFISNEHKLFAVKNLTNAKRLFPIQLRRNAKLRSGRSPPAEGDNGQTTSHLHKTLALKPVFFKYLRS